MSAAIVRADALHLPLGNETVDLIVTSPPYFALRSYQDGGEHYDGQIGSEPTPTAFLEALWAVTAECWRVLKPTGSLFLNLGDKYAGSGGHNNANLSRLHQTDGRSVKERVESADAGHRKIGAARRTAPNRYNQESGGVRKKSLMNLPARYAIGCTDGMADPDGVGWVQRAEIIWSKPNGMPESVTDRVRRCHEHWFHLTKEGTYYGEMQDLRRPHSEVSLRRAEPHRADPGRAHREGKVEGAGPPQSFRLAQMNHPDGALPGSVWSIATQPLKVPDWLEVDHFAAFPTEWPRRLISAWCPPDGVVLDPFGGTGTTAMVARALGRFGVSMDLSADYLRLARWRIFESGQAAKVAARTDRDNQGVLL